MAGIFQSIIFVYIIALHGLLILKFQENNHKTNKNDLNEQKEALKAKDQEISSCFNELNDSKRTCDKKIEKSNHKLQTENTKISEKLSTFTETANTCKADLEQTKTEFMSVQNKLKTAEKQQLDINKTYEREVQKLTKTFEGQVSSQKERIQQIGQDRKDRVIKLADQLSNLRGQLDELVNHIESEHKVINEVHHLED